MRKCVLACLLLAGVFGLTPSARADAARAALSDNSAIPLSPGQWRVALFAPTRVGVTRGLELSTHPLSFWIFPHIDAKAKLSARGPLTVSILGRLSYPTLLLDILAKEGALGLLPKTADVPAMLGIDAELCSSLALQGGHVFSSCWGVLTAPRLTDGNFPLLDFPFLYGRFAQTKTFATFRSRLTLSTTLSQRLYQRVDISYTVIPVRAVQGTKLQGAFALEPSWFWGFVLCRRWLLEASLSAHVARLPVGLRLHWLPALDLQAWF